MILRDFLRVVAQKSLCPEALRLQYAFNLRTLDKPESGKMVLLPLLPFFSLSSFHALSLCKRFIDKYHKQVVFFYFYNIFNTLLFYLCYIPFIYLYMYVLAIPTVFVGHYFENYFATLLYVSKYFNLYSMH